MAERSYRKAWFGYGATIDKSKQAAWARMTDGSSTLLVPRTLVALATYNERENLAALVETILDEMPFAHVLVVDDASPDGTGILADELAKKYAQLAVVHRPGKQGLGSAIIACMRYAMDKRYDYLITLDADFSHPPKNVPALVGGMKDHDVMIGSRYVPGGGIVGWDWKRHVMSRCINAYTRILLGVPARDCSGDFRCYRVAKLHAIDFQAVRSRGYSFMEEILYHCHRAGCRIGETPIVFENRKMGASKINSLEAVKALWVLFVVALGRLLPARRRTDTPAAKASPDG